MSSVVSEDLKRICIPSLQSFAILQSGVFQFFSDTRMSSCDCDRKDSNGGTCDSSCKEETFSIMDNSSSPSFTPVLTATKAAATLESAPFNCCSMAPCSI